MSQSKQLTVFVTFHVKPELVEQFKEVHRPVWAACAAEPESILFDVFQDPEKPGLFRFVEVWNGTKECFEQLTKSYYATLYPKSKPTWESDVQLEYFKWEGEGFSYKKAYFDAEKQWV